jgi:hypothetical protein
MKTAMITQDKNRPALPYPNAATRRQILNKILDLLLTGAIGAGIAAMLLFLMVLR